MSRVQQLGHWLWSPIELALLFLLLPFILPVVAATLPSSEKESIRLLQASGLFLQVLGFTTVWWQIRSAVRQHGRPTWNVRLRTWWNRRPWGRPHIIFAAGVGNVGLSGGLAYGIVRQGKGDGSHEARLAALEFNLSALEKEVTGYRNACDDRMRDVDARLKAEGEARAAALTSVSERLAEQAVGNADLQYTGLFWFIAGAVVATIPDTIAPFLRHLA